VSGTRITGWSLLRGLAIMAVGVWGWFIVAQFRTQQVGFSAGVLVAMAIFVLPLAILPFLGLSWTRGIAGLAGLLLAVVGLVEWMAVTEEYAFRARHEALPPGSKTVFEARRWPFSDHYLAYDPSTGVCTGGD
jgi:hypothetical protein